MKKELNSLINELDYLDLAGVKYYSLNSFEKLLTKIPNKNIEIMGVIIAPFYISDSRVFELYDYELNIRVVDAPNFNNFILSKTGVNTISEIDSKIVHKLSNCYAELIKPEKNIQADILYNYIKFVKNSSEINERIVNLHHEFDDNKLFFEIY